MLDFTPVRNKEITMNDLTADLTVNDLRNLMNEMIDTILDIIKESTDEDVYFTPVDAEANDTFAADDADADLAWNLGHLVVHATASNEEAAALAAEMARGVPFERRRSRSEVPWEVMKTIDQCRQRLEESRRMCLASLDMWPDEPNLDITFQWGKDSPDYNAIVRYVFGLSHADSHLGQFADVAQQAKAARS